MTTVEHICMSDRPGLKQPQQTVAFSTGIGVEEDWHAGVGHRQVSLLAREDILALAKGQWRPGTFSENIVTHGLDLADLGVGSRLRLGNEVVLKISQTGKHFHQPDHVERISGEFLMAHAGVFATVECGGEVSSGAAIEVLEAIPRSATQAVVITVSDRCHRGETIDTAGPAVAELLQNELQAHIQHTEVVPDDRSAIIEALKRYCDQHSVDLLVTAGGTGPAPRDITPEATREVVERPTPGFDEAMRYASLAKTPTAILSRGTSGIRGATFIVNLPGSERGAVENMEAIIKALPHGIKKLRGDPADCACCRERLADERKHAHG